MNPASLDEIELVRRFLERGRSSVRPDAGHLVFWGLTLCVGLGLQYPAEVLDWAPSATLWIWQPFALLAWAGFLMSRRRASSLDDPTRYACRAAFGAAGLATAASYAGALAGRAPDGYPTVLVACASAALAFVVAAALTRRAVAWGAAAGWLVLLAWFAWRGLLVPSDFLLLAGACAALLAAPGLLLARKRPTETDGGVFS